MTDLKFPIGPFVLKDFYTSEELTNIVSSISTAPAAYRRLVADLTDDDLKRGYREGSWNVRQLIHHVADIALLHYFRMK
ncbi:MAG TPA: DinB family protein, partial [Dyadobacter sp.]|nr:DinB family protein [Dyadobacter sp.]